MTDLQLLEGPVTSAETDSAATAESSVPVEASDSSSSAGAAVEIAASGTESAEIAAAAPEATGIQYPDESEAEAEAESAPVAENADAAANEAGREPTSSLRHGPQSLTKLIGDHTELKAFLDANPRAKSQLYQLARRSGELSEYQQIVPTLGRAREAAEAMRSLEELDHHFLEGSPEDFFSRLWDAQATLDPLTGQRVSSGVYERHVRFLHGLMLDALGRDAEQARDGKLQSAVEVIREAIMGPRSSPASDATDSDLSPSIRRRLAEAERAEAELRDLRLRRSEEAAEREEHFKQEIVRDTAGQLEEFARGLLANTGLNEYAQRSVARDFIEKIAELADRDPAHAAAMEDLFRQSHSPETRERLVAKALGWARRHAREVLEPIVRGAAEATRREQERRESVRAARQRPEPSGGGIASPPARPSVRDLISRREGSLKRRLSDREILDL